ncbi:hypothetical protein ERN12_02535 [Rhodobacteraceae bacterium]|nr:hypothetical protein ERN12_02535 [Paracoccaceae bacterium]
MTPEPRTVFPPTEHARAEENGVNLVSISSKSQKNMPIFSGEHIHEVAPDQFRNLSDVKGAETRVRARPPVPHTAVQPLDKFKDSLKKWAIAWMLAIPLAALILMAIGFFVGWPT